MYIIYIYACIYVCICVCIYEELPERKSRSNLAAAQVTRALPVTDSRPLYVKGNTCIGHYGVIIFSHVCCGLYRRTHKWKIPLPLKCSR
jgi:hypothetical protein